MTATPTTAPEAMLDMIVDWLCSAASAAAARGDVEAVKRLASAPTGFGHGSVIGCDGCDATYMVDVLDHACDLVPSHSVACDSNGDPDVAICGFCVLDYDPSDEYVVDVDQQIRWIQEDHDDVESYMLSGEM